MRIVFDKENAKSFFRNLDDHTLGNDILNLLKRQVDLQFNFTLDEIEEELELQILEFEETGGRKANNLTISYNKEVKETPFCIDDVLANSNVYLLSNVSKKLKNSFKVLVGEEGEELEILSKLFVNGKEADLHDQEVIGKKDFKNWKGINKYVRPFSTIVVVDRFMFKGPELGGNLGLFDYNLKSILEEFYRNQNQKTRICFIYQISPHRPKDHKDYDEGPDQEKLRKRICKVVKAVNRNCPKPDIYFIAVPKFKIADDHDRHIITNYTRFKSGDSLVYFDSKGDIITDSNEFDIYSLAKNKYRYTTGSLLDKIQEITAETLAKFADRCYTNGETNAKEIINF